MLRGSQASGTGPRTKYEDLSEVLRSVAALEFSHLAKFAFLLCQKLNGYYHKYPVLAEENPEVRAFRLLLLKMIKEQLHTALGLMGIPPPERM